MAKYKHTPEDPNSDPRDREPADEAPATPPDEAPETPPDEPKPVPVKDPPAEPKPPYTVTREDIVGDTTGE